MARYCSNCGTALKDDQRFCPNCGTPAPSQAAEPAQPQGQGTDPWAVSGGGAPRPDAAAGCADAFQGGSAPGGEGPQPSQPFQPGAGYGAGAQGGAAAYGYGAPGAVTKKQFLTLPENRKIRTEIRSAGIICYICAGITLVLALISLQMTALLDVAILVGLGLGVHLAQSRACAILLTVYAGINMLITLVVLGRFGGWLVLLAGIFAIVYTFKFQKLWKAYQMGGRG